SFDGRARPPHPNPLPVEGRGRTRLGVSGARGYLAGSFPLTPALSLRERETRRLVPEFVSGDEIDREMVFENFDVRLGGDGGEQGAFNFTTCDVFSVENATAGMAAFLAQIELARAIGRAGFAFAEAH